MTLLKCLRAKKWARPRKHTDGAPWNSRWDGEGRGSHDPTPMFALHTPPYRRTIAQQPFSSALHTRRLPNKNENLKFPKTRPTCSSKYQRLVRNECRSTSDKKAKYNFPCYSKTVKNIGEDQGNSETQWSNKTNNMGHVDQ